MILMLPCMYAPLSPNQARLQVLRTKTHGPKFEEAGDDLDIDGELEDDWGVVDEEEAWGHGRLREPGQSRDLDFAGFLSRERCRSRLLTTRCWRSTCRRWAIPP